MKKWESGEKANRPTLLTPSQGERSVLCSVQSGFTCKAGVKPGLLCSLQNISKCAMACFALHKTRCHMYIVQYTYVRSRCSTSNNHYKMSAKNISMAEQSHTKSTFGANRVHGEKMWKNVSTALWGSSYLELHTSGFFNATSLGGALEWWQKEVTNVTCYLCKLYTDSFSSCECGAYQWKRFRSMVHYFTFHCSLFTTKIIQVLLYVALFHMTSSTVWQKAQYKKVAK